MADRERLQYSATRELKLAVRVLREAAEDLTLYGQDESQVDPASVADRVMLSCTRAINAVGTWEESARGRVVEMRALED
jgi:hypothetical protein